MNVEQLIEDGWKKHKAEAGIRSDAGFEAFRFGVRYALAAMFPVVKPGDLKKGEAYWGIGANGCGPILGRSSVSGKFWDYENQEAYRLGAFAEYRRCPTPSELGVG